MNSNRGYGTNALRLRETLAGKYRSFIYVAGLFLYFFYN